MAAPTSDVAYALTQPTRSWRFNYYAVNAAGAEVRELTVEDCKVSNNDLADKVKRTCTVRLAKSSTFDQLTERFRPYATLILPSGSTAVWCLGTFYLSSATDALLTQAGESSRDFVGYDMLLALDEEKLTDRYVEGAGANPTTQLSTHLANRGFPTSGIIAQSKTLPAPLEWQPGTSILTLLNDLLGAVGYRSLYMDEQGVPRGEPYVNPATAPVVWAYAPDTKSVIVPGVEVTLDLFGVPNKWTAYVSEPDRPTLTSTYTNTNSLSPTSTVSRGRTINEVIQLQQSPEGGDVPPVDQATLDAKVQQMAQQASQVYSDVSMTTGLMPFHGAGDVVTLDTGAGPIRYREASWSLECKPGGRMEHTLRRVVLI